MDPVGPSDEAPTARGLAAGERVFGRFRLVRRVGQGGMGEVWLARDERLECDVALKFLQERFRWDEAALLALRTETRRTRELNHPGIVRIHDLHEDQGQTAIAMEFLPGGSLHAQRCRRDPPVFTPAEILAWLPQLCAALDHAHAAGVVHRDLKPSNLLLAADGGVKIGDFGIAQPLAESALRISQWAPSGTLAYMGPQQHFGEPPAPSDDVYSLGATLYELLTGKPPFYSGNLAAQIERRVPDSLAERRRQLGLGRLAPPAREWEATIAACLAKRAEDRPRSARFVLDLLRGPSAAVDHVGRVRRRFSGRAARLGMGAFGLSVAWLAFEAGFSGDRVSAPKAALAAAGEAGGSSETKATHPSDATRAWAAWNLDGDGRDVSGGGLDLETARVIPTRDRFGRIDRAVFLNGMAFLQRRAPSWEGWTADSPFTVSVWVRIDRAEEGDVIIVGLRPERQDDFYWRLGAINGRPAFSFGRIQVDDPEHATAAEALPVGRWSLLTGVSDGRTLRLWVDDREVATEPIVRNRGARVSGPAVLRFGQTDKFDPAMLNGALDDARIWRRALAPEEIARLASPEAPPRLAATRGVYSADSDHGADVVREFGVGARPGDWRDLESWHRDDIVVWCDELGLTTSGTGPHLTYDGKRNSTGTRGYFLNRFDGKRPDYYKVHAELGGMTLALGSWHGVTTRILAKLPPAKVSGARLRAGADGAIDAGIPDEVLRTAIALEWSHDLQPRGGPIEATVRLRDGRTLVAACGVAGDGLLGVGLGTRDRPERARQLAATYGHLRFALVVHDGRIAFRAVATLGSAVIFHEILPFDFRAEDVVGVTLRGVDFAELTIEE